MKERGRWGKRKERRKERSGKRRETKMRETGNQRERDRKTEERDYFLLKSLNSSTNMLQRKNTLLTT